MHIPLSSQPCSPLEEYFKAGLLCVARCPQLISVAMIERRAGTCQCVACTSQVQPRIWDILFLGQGKPAAGIWVMVTWLQPGIMSGHSSHHGFFLHCHPGILPLSLFSDCLPLTLVLLTPCFPICEGVHPSQLLKST